MTEDYDQKITPEKHFPVWSKPGSQGCCSIYWECFIPLKSYSVKSREVCTSLVRDFLLAEIPFNTAHAQSRCSCQHDNERISKDTENRGTAHILKVVKHKTSDMHGPVNVVLTPLCRAGSWFTWKSCEVTWEEPVRRTVTKSSSLGME